MLNYLNFLYPTFVQSTTGNLNIRPPVIIRIQLKHYPIANYNSVALNKKIAKMTKKFAEEYLNFINR